MAFLQVRITRFVCEQMLCHRFPRVRRYCAENFYVRLLEIPEMYDTSDPDHPALTHLLGGTWDIDMTKESAEKMAGNVMAGLQTKEAVV